MVARSSHTGASEGRGTDASPLGIPPELAVERGAFFVWPDLRAPYYADSRAAAERVALKGWRRGATALPVAPLRGTPAVRYLAADVTALRGLTGLEEPLAAIAAYERAVRSAPDFPDAPRALVNAGFAALRRDLVPEAEILFARVLREHAGGAYVALAGLGRATALRHARRWDEAQSALDAIAGRPPASLRCAVDAERAALARARGDHAAAVVLDEPVARDCPALDAMPGVVAARADSLLAVGRHAQAAALLSRGVAALDPESQADLFARAGEIARGGGDPVAARAAFERALGLRIGPSTRAVVQARIARIDAAVGPDRALATLDALAASAPAPAARAEIVGVAADTLADLWRYRDALARLDEPSGTADGVPPSLRARRDAILGRWIAALDAADDATGVLAVYGAYRRAVDTGAAAPTVDAVVRALAGAGLSSAALRLVRVRDDGADPHLALLLAETALAAGEPAAARRALDRLRGAVLAPPLAGREGAVALRVLVAEDALERVPPDGPGTSDPLALRELAAAWVARGDVALAAGAPGDAAAAYERAVRIAPGPALRAAAAGALVTARAAGPGRPGTAVEELAGVGDPVVRRGVAVVTATRAFGAPGPEEPSHVR